MSFSTIILYECSASNFFEAFNWRFDSMRLPTDLFGNKMPRFRDGARNICENYNGDSWLVHTYIHWYSVGRRMVFFVCEYGGILFRALATEAWLVCRKVGNITTKLSHATVEVLMNLGEEPLTLERNCLPLNNPTTG